MAKVTIREIADKLKVSPATVSLALNDRPGVKPETRERVLSLVHELNYTGGGRASGGETIRGRIGLLVCKRYGKIVTDSQFFTELIAAVERAACKADLALMLFYARGEEDLERALTMVRGSDLAGLLVLGTELKEEDTAPFHGLDIPLVILDNDLYGCRWDTVKIHNADGIWNAMEYLVSLGHRDIGYLRSSFPIRNFHQRFLNYENCLSCFGLTGSAPKQYFLEPTAEGAEADVLELMKQGVPLPTAFVADNDLIAIGALKAFAQVGIRIPEELSLVGFDDIPAAAILEPALTSVKVPCEDLGNVAVGQILWRMGHRLAVARTISVRTSLTIRNTVAKPKNAE